MNAPGIAMVAFPVLAVRVLAIAGSLALWFWNTMAFGVVRARRRRGSRCDLRWNSSPHRPDQPSPVG